MRVLQTFSTTAADNGTADPTIAAQELQAAGTLGITANDVQAVRDAFTFVEIGDGPGTDPPGPFPGTEGEDAALFVRFAFIFGSR